MIRATVSMLFNVRFSVNIYIHIYIYIREDISEKLLLHVKCVNVSIKVFLGYTSGWLNLRDNQFQPAFTELGFSLQFLKKILRLKLWCKFWEIWKKT